MAVSVAFVGRTGPGHDVTLLTPLEVSTLRRATGHFGHSQLHGLRALAILLRPSRETFVPAGSCTEGSRGMIGGAWHFHSAHGDSAGRICCGRDLLSLCRCPPAGSLGTIAGGGFVSPLRFSRTRLARCQNHVPRPRIAVSTLEAEC